MIQLSENSNSITHANSTSHDSDDIRETAFNDSSTSTLVGTGLLTRQLSSDPKLEKKVTFARLLSKMSAEITSGSDIDVSEILTQIRVDFQFLMKKILSARDITIIRVL